MYVFIVKKNLSDKTSNIILGLASGVMIAAGIFGLLIPAMEEAEFIYKNLSFIPVFGGFILGGIFLNILDKIIPHFHNKQGEEEGPKSNLAKQIKFFLAVLIHNIPDPNTVDMKIIEHEIIITCTTFITYHLLTYIMFLLDFSYY